MQEHFQEASRWLKTETFGSDARRSKAVSVDLENRAEALVLTADLSGFSKEDIDVRVTDRTLRLEAEYEESPKRTKRASTCAVSAAARPSLGPFRSPKPSVQARPPPATPTVS
jgi:HSP20 family molecular chaperone IbpA